MANQYNFEGYGYLAIDPDTIPGAGPGFAGRLLSLHAAAAKPIEGPTVLTQENYNLAMNYLDTHQTDNNLLVRFIGQNNVTNPAALNTYKRLCRGIRRVLNLTTGVWAIKEGRTMSRLAVPQDNLNIVIQMLQEMRQQVTTNRPNQERPEITHLNVVFSEAIRINNAYELAGGTYSADNIPDRVESVMNIFSNIPLGSRKNGGYSLWATAVVKLQQLHDARADTIKKALSILALNNGYDEDVRKIIEVSTQLLNQEQQEVNQVNVFSQMSNVDYLFNIFFWFWWLKRTNPNWDYGIFQNMIAVITTVYYNVDGAQKVRRILQNTPSIFAKQWIAKSNTVTDKFQAPWNPSFARLRWLSLFIPTVENRMTNPRSLSYGHDTALTNWNRLDARFWNRLIMVWTAEQEDQKARQGTRIFTSLHVLHRLIVGFESPLQNTQNVAGSALNVEIVPLEAAPMRPIEQRPALIPGAQGKVDSQPGTSRAGREQVMIGGPPEDIDQIPFNGTAL